MSSTVSLAKIMLVPYPVFVISACLNSFMLRSMMVLGKMASFMSTKSAMTTLTVDRETGLRVRVGRPGVNLASSGSTSLSTGKAHFSRKLEIHLEFYKVYFIVMISMSSV